MEIVEHHKMSVIFCFNHELDIVFRRVDLCNGTAFRLTVFTLDSVPGKKKITFSKFTTNFLKQYDICLITAYMFTIHFVLDAFC